MKIARIHKRVALAAALLACATSSVFAQADQKTQEKIRLMVAAVQARDNGDLQASKQALEELLKIAPDDAGVKRMMNDVNADIERKNKGETPLLVNPNAKVTVVEETVVEETQGKEAAAEEAEEPAPDPTVADAVRKVQMQIVAAYDLIDEAYDAMDEARWNDANASLDQATSKLPANEYAPMADDARAEIKRARATMAKERAKIAMSERNVADAKAFAKDYADNEADLEKGKAFVEKADKFDDNPYNHTLADTSPEYAARKNKVDVLIQKGTRQYLYGDYQGARSSFRQVEALDADNIEAKAYQKLISEKLETNAKLTYQATRAGLLDQVGRSWQLPQVYTGQTVAQAGEGRASPVEAKLNSIIIPEVNYPNAKFSEVIKTLGDVSVFYDKAEGKKGVNIVLFADEADAQKPININLREVSLGKVLSWVTRQAGYNYDIEDETIVVRKAQNDPGASFETQDFPIPDTAVTKMVGMKAASASSDSSDPFGGGGGTASGVAPENKEELIKNFFIKLGVEFAPGANIAYDGTKLWVTNTTRNLEKVRRILLRYNEVKQVEIEAKFMEVNQGDLKELNFNWKVSKGEQTLFSSANRNLVTSVSTSGTGKETMIYNADPTAGQTSTTPVENLWPVVPSTMNLGENNLGMVSAIIGTMSGYDVNLMVDALEQKQGSDLLCSPKVTVTSGNTAAITVSQQIRYPENWGDMQSNVGTSSGDNTGSAGVTVTPGTPQDFVSKDIGVVMEVTPNVQEDGSTIDMALNPCVTEFEGWMEYGGTAVAIQGYTTVTIPSGFIQPVFSVREIRTNVTVFDGATVVMGGLTREDIRSLDDQVPILGDIPFIGRLFQAKGESRQKKNLLIFITANRISPGGSVVREQFQEMRPGSVFQNPIIVSPGGAVQRVLEDETTSE